MDPTFLWFCAIGLIAIGVVGTVLPGVPGAMAVFGGMLLAAWIDGFTLIGWPTLVLLGLLTALAFAADILGSLLGAQRVGASRLALVGAVLGTRWARHLDRARSGFAGEDRAGVRDAWRVHDQLHRGLTRRVTSNSKAELQLSAGETRRSRSASAAP